MCLDVCVNMKLTTKIYGHENSWEFGPCSSSQVYANNQEYSERCCLTPGEYTLRCIDTYGDGWHQGSIEINGNDYCGDFERGHEATRQITIEGKYTFDF